MAHDLIGCYIELSSVMRCITLLVTIIITEVKNIIKLHYIILLVTKK